jgi:ABC-type Fe3+-hydroxamate transport system substrate-binding protein
MPFIDVRGKSLELKSPPRRVVSLVPSITETLFDLGVGRSVIGITDYCIFPDDLALPRVGGTKNPDIGAIRALAPDLVHMNLEENLKRHADEIESFAPLFVSEPKTIQDVILLILGLGEIHGATSRASEIAKSIETARATLQRSSFTFACPIWKKPWMWCGGVTYVSRLVEAAGGINVFANEMRYPPRELDAVAAMRPDIIFLPDEPFAFTADDARDLRALTRSRVVGPFPGHLFTWHGSRTLLGLEFLRDTLA